MTRTLSRGTGLVLHPVDAIDPRTLLDDRALVEASRNSFPVVARARARRDGMGLATGGGIALLLGGLTFWTMSGHRAAPPPAPLPATRAPLLAPPVPAAAPAPRLAVPPPVGGLHMPAVPSVAITPVANPAQAPTMVFDASSAPLPQAAASPASPATPAAKIAAAKPALASGGNANDQFASRLDSGTVEVATAERLSDPSTTVTQGTLIPAVLETAIDTDLPGYVRALVSRDVLSFDGKRVLIPRSSRLIGQYKSGLTAGQTRVYVIWTRLIRPDGASVELASPAVDFSGSSGLAGKVNSHFFKRFSSALLLSVVGGLSSIGNASVVLSGGQSPASVAAQHDSQIPPTIKVPQGQPIRVFTAKDLDFSTVTPASAQG